MDAALLATQHLTPLTDRVVRIGLIGASGAVLGGIGGFVLALLVRPIEGIEVRILGFFGLELGITYGARKYEFGTAIAICSAVGSIGILAMKVLEYYGVI